jgi:hypothetical protein
MCQLPEHIPVPASVVADPNLSDLAVVVYIGLCSIAGTSREWTKATVDEIADACGSDRSAKPRRARKGLKELVDAGLVEYHSAEGYFRLLPVPGERQKGGA